MRQRAAWSTKWGFYFAAVGSAFGLGNLWRFPYIVGSSGGGAFLIIYIFVVLFIGLPLLVAELLLGKVTQRSVVGALEEVEAHEMPSRVKDSFFYSALRKMGPWVGRLAIGSCLLLISYYAVVSGWVIHFILEFFVGLFKPMAHSEGFGNLQENGLLQILLGGIHLLLVSVVVSRGLQQGVEKWIGYSIPVFVVLLLYLMSQSLALEGAQDALRFLFYPDFSKLTLSTLLRAVGHAFFTLSLGLGAMVAFGSYMHEHVRIPEAGLRVSLIDTVLSICVGVLIFPIVFTGGLRVDSGPTILFETVPLLLRKVGLSELFGFAFFLCTYLAAFGASLGLFESVVSHIMDYFRMGRRKASFLAGFLALSFSVWPALSSSILGSFRVNGMNLLQTMDYVLIHWLLPLVGIGISLSVGFRMRIKTLRNEFVWDSRSSTTRLFTNWVFALRWVIPIIVGIALVLEIVGFFSRL